MGVGGLVAGVIVSLGGQTPLKLAGSLPPDLVLGTSPASIDLAEDREPVERLVPPTRHPPAARWHRHGHRRGTGRRRPVGYPVLLRPSYVLGGRAMEIVYDDDGVRRVMQSMTTGALAREGGVTAERPVLVDRFLEDAVEVDVDAVRDETGEVLIVGIMEHVEEAGVHSGDSACALPPQTLGGRRRGAPRALHPSAGRSTRGAGPAQRPVRRQGWPGVRPGGEPVGEPDGAVRGQAALGAPGHGGGPRHGWSDAGPTAGGGSLSPEAVGRVPVLDHVSVKEAVLPFDRFPGVDTSARPRDALYGRGHGDRRHVRARFRQEPDGGRHPLARRGHRVSLLGRPGQAGGPRSCPRLQRAGFSIAATLGTAGYLLVGRSLWTPWWPRWGRRAWLRDAVDLIAGARCSWW